MSEGLIRPTGRYHIALDGDGPTPPKPHPDAFWCDKYGWLEEVEPAGTFTVPPHHVRPSIAGERLSPGKYLLVKVDDDE